MNGCEVSMRPARSGATTGKVERHRRVRGRGWHLIVYDGVPWALHDILRKARRREFGRKDYDDAVARLRLKQAFGRLVWPTPTSTARSCSSIR